MELEQERALRRRLEQALAGVQPPADLLSRVRRRHRRRSVARAVLVAVSVGATATAVVIPTALLQGRVDPASDRPAHVTATPRVTPTRSPDTGEANGPCGPARPGERPLTPGGVGEWVRPAPAGTRPKVTEAQARRFFTAHPSVDGRKGGDVQLLVLRSPNGLRAGSGCPPRLVWVRFLRDVTVYPRGGPGSGGPAFYTGCTEADILDATSGRGISNVQACTPQPTPPACAPPPRDRAAVAPEPVTAGRWSLLPPAPIDGRDSATIVWTGREMLVWGGASGRSGGVLHADGASYDPQAGRWSPLPPAPLAARTGQAAVWTGRELVVWGGYTGLGPGRWAITATGAAYDPRARRWRALAPAPLTARVHAAAVWTGQEVVILGGQPAVITDRLRGYHDGAAWDPATDHWRRLPSSPLRIQPLLGVTKAVWTGSAVLVFHEFGITDDPQALQVEALDPVTGSWRSVDNCGGPGWVQAGYPAGDQLFFPPYESATGYLFDPRSERWQPIPPSSIDSQMGPGAWTGQRYYALNTGEIGRVQPGDGTVWDLRSNTWQRLPRAPYGPSLYNDSIWTGHEMIHWGVLYDRKSKRGVTAGLRFTPAG